MASDSAPSRSAVLRAAAREGGELALDSFRSSLVVETKSAALDTVTEVDRAVQRRIVERIRSSFPDDAIVAEEATTGTETAVPTDGVAWVVDPIDGTNNYVNDARTWATSVALVRDGDPVAAVNHLPAMGDTYAAETNVVRNEEPVAVTDRSDPESVTVSPLFGLQKQDRPAFVRLVDTVSQRFGDVRRLGSAQATLSMVASGELDAAVSLASLPPWDSIAGVHLVRAAGGRATTLSGERWDHGDASLVVSNGHVHDELLRALS